MMTFGRTLIASVVVLLIGATTAMAQTTGEIFGRAADASGAVLPGATVTITSPALIRPRVAVTSAAGTYNVPELPVGMFTAEGCSSRPPADRLLAIVAREQPVKIVSGKATETTVIELKSGWKREHLRIVAFVQSTTSGHVLSVGWSKLSTPH